jgi:hypothetical protein
MCGMNARERKHRKPFHYAAEAMKEGMRKEADLMTSAPGALTNSVSLPFDAADDADGGPIGQRAAIDSESLPPSIAMPTCVIIAATAAAASYMRAPSPGSLAAHIPAKRSAVGAACELHAWYANVRLGFILKRETCEKSDRHYKTNN